VKRGGTVPISIWIMLGLLAVGMILLTLGKRQNETLPSAVSYGPSGAGAFAELLRREGYDVRIERSIPPRLRQTDAAVAFFAERTPPLSEDAESALERVLFQHADRGGTLVLLPFRPAFPAASRSAAEPAPANNAYAPLEEPVELFLDRGIPAHASFAAQPALEPAVDLWRIAEGAETVTRLYRVGKGRTLAFRDGVMVTNRFLDRGANAAVAVGSIRAVVPAGGRIVFVEGSFRPGASPSLMAAIGPWAEGASWQLTFLFLVVVYTLGKRFGLPDEQRKKQHGSRELVDAMGEVYARGRMTSPALVAAREDAKWTLKRALKLPQDALEETYLWKLPESLQSAYANVDTAIGMKLRGEDALRLVRRLDREVGSFLHAREPDPRRARSR
jgi:hypothetical protein